MDFNKLENEIDKAIGENRIADAAAIIYFMIGSDDGFDRSFDGGSLAARLADCYRILGMKEEEVYWGAVAHRENPYIYPNPGNFLSDKVRILIGNE